MNIIVNEQPLQVAEGCALPDAIETFGAKEPYAIMLNDNFLPKSSHQETVLAENDKVEVISAIQGG